MGTDACKLLESLLQCIEKMVFQPRPKPSQQSAIGVDAASSFHAASSSATQQQTLDASRRGGMMPIDTMQQSMNFQPAYPSQDMLSMSMRPDSMQHSMMHSDMLSQSMSHSMSFDSRALYHGMHPQFVA